MYEFFLFDLQAQISADQRPQRIAVVFGPYSGFAVESLRQPLKDFFGEVPPPDAIVFLGTEAEKGELQPLTTSDPLKDFLPGETRYSDPPPVYALWQCNDGSFKAGGDTDRDRYFSGEAFLSRMFREGLLAIFERRHGVLEATRAYHYVKPSGKHCDKFIRTGNVLIRGAEVAFAAFCALPYLKDDVAHIYTDTAAINVVAFAMILLKQRLDQKYKPPSVDSYGSYAGVGRFRFDLAQKSLFLVSASTSGDLEKLLVTHQASADRIVTLYYLGSGPPGGGVLCNLTRHRRGSSGYETITSHQADECPLCGQGSLAVRITGDQFLPEDPKVVPVVLTKEDAPKWLNGFAQDFVGGHILRSHYSPTPGQGQEIFIDLQTLLERASGSSAAQSASTEAGAEFLSALTRILIQTIPVNLQRIIHLDDPASEALASLALTHFTGKTASVAPPKLVCAKDLTEELKKKEKYDGTTLAVAGVLVSGRRLMAVSQALRQLQKNNAISYLIGVVRTRNEDHFEEVRNNLQYGAHGSRDFDLHYVHRISLPDRSQWGVTPWGEETELLKKLLTPRCEQSFKECLETRLGVLEPALRHRVRGLEENLFWGKPLTNETLQLRSNFAFWSFGYDQTKVSQAEVYFTIATVLHSLREGTRSNRGRLEQGHHHAILSPRCFDRFNDGVVQASLLRAARAVELDYSADDRQSSEMRRILEFVFGNVDSDSGEATVEFLVALAAGRLRLLREHAQEAIKTLRAKLGTANASQRATLEGFCSYITKLTSNDHQ